MITAVRRKVDGLLADVQESAFFPADTSPRLQNAIAQLGGTAEDWAVYEVPASEWQNINLFGRQFATLSNNQITTLAQSNPPVLTASKNSLVADGIETALLEARFSDASYRGSVKWTIVAPEGDVLVSSENAVAGVASLSFSTLQEGLHRMMVETELHGVASLEIEGI